MGLKGSVSSGSVGSVRLMDLEVVCVRSRSGVSINALWSRAGLCVKWVWPVF